MEGNVVAGDLLVRGQAGILTESGIILESGETLKQGKILEFASKAKKLLDSGDMDGFVELLDGPAEDELSLDEQCILLRTEVTDKHDDILGMLCHIEVMNAANVFDDGK